MATTTRLAALVGGLAIAITSCSPSTTSSVPAADTETAPTAVADISDPIAVTAESGEPFRGVNEQPVAGPGLPLPVLVPYGYVEEEYFVSGAVDGKPYSTSLLVRKPQDPARFSGLVAVETIHAAGAIPLWGSPDDRYRHYQIVGASHVGTRGVTDPLEIFPTLANVMEPGDQLSRFPNGFSTAATYNLVAWVTEGVAPPKAPVIEIADGEIVRDEFGNARGGVRSPYVDMPTARYMPAARGLIGLQEPIPADRLQSLYGSKAEYLERFEAEIDKLVDQRWLLPESGERLKSEEAERAAF